MDTTHAIHRNKVFLITYTEYVYRKLLKNADYSMQEIAGIVDGYISLEELNDFFDKFTIAFADFCTTQNWDKTSASLGIDENGKNIARPTDDLLKDFKQHLGTQHGTTIPKPTLL